MFTITVFGKSISYQKYNIPSINYENNFLFSFYDKNCTKMILTDNKGNFIKAKYIEQKIELNNEELLITSFKNSSNIIKQNNLNFCNFEYFEKFPPDNCLKKNILFTIWFGESYTPIRNSCFISLKNVSQCKVLSINENNIHLLKYPIHKSFNYLSSIHKSDYLRCYLMYYYGGGYSDLKKTSSSWVPAFNKLKNNKNLWAVGYDCDGIAFPSNLQQKTGFIDYNECTIEFVKKLQKNLNNFIGVGFFIFKKNTELVNKWFEELNKRLDFFYEDLKKYPAKFGRESKNGTPRPTWEGGNFNTKYPICWNRILGQILYPLQLDYLDRVTKGIPKRVNCRFR